MRRGKFITLEGIDGAGKSTHLRSIQKLLEARHIPVVVTREPGGTPLGEKLRSLLLHEPMSLEAETLLMFAARAEHVGEVIRPALEAGHWVLSDRFTDATFAYQGGGRGVAGERLSVLEQWVQADLQPDLTLYFDVPVAVGRHRRRNAATDLDRFEGEDVAFFERVRQAYLTRAAQFPSRIFRIEADQPLEKINQTVEECILRICKDADI